MARQYGQQLLLTAIEERAASDWSRPYASIPIDDDDVLKGYMDVTYARFSNAINRCAQWLEVEIGQSDNLETIAYIGPQDLRYQILTMAACKTGYVTFLLSPRNSIEVQLELMKQASVTKLITPRKRLPTVRQIEAAKIAKIIEIPELTTLLDEKIVTLPSFAKAFDEYRFVPWVLLHTSGSTGIPKIIPIRHGYLTANDAYWLFGNELAERCGKTRVFNPFPSSHMVGLMWSLPFAIWIDATFVMSSTAPLTGDLANKIHVNARVDCSSLPPSVVSELSQNKEWLSSLGKLRNLSFAGGPLPQAIGDKVSRYCFLGTSYGSTEMGAIPLMKRSPEDWQYFNFDIDHGGLDFRQIEPDLYELFIVRKPELDLMQAVFVTFPDIDEYPTNDLFTPHPTKKGLWRYSGRTDDVIVFENGEKLNPTTMESVMNSSPDVSGSCVVGQGKFQPAVIVELRHRGTSPTDEHATLERIWQYVQKANSQAPGHGKIVRELVIISSADKPFARAAKGTMQRKATIKMYQSEIESAYETMGHLQTSTYLDYSNPEAMKASLRALLLSQAGIQVIKDSDDLFEHGFDSLQAAGLARSIRSSSCTMQIEAKHIYENPSIHKLTMLLMSTSQRNLLDDDEQIETWTDMQQTFRESRQDLEDLSGTLRSGLAKQHKEHYPYNAAHDEMFLTSMVPPDGGWRAWSQILACFLINMNNWGLVNAFGVYQDYYGTTMLSNYSGTTIAWIGTLQAALLLIVGVLSGFLFDQGHFRIVLVSGGLALVFAYMMVSLCTQFWQLILAQGVLAGAASGFLYIPSVALMSSYFRDRRGLALGLCTAGGSLGGVIYPIIFQALLEAVGFGWANRVIAFIVLGILIASAILIKPLESMKRPSRQLFEMSALTELPFLSLILSAFFLFSGFLVPFFLEPAFAVSLGTSQKLALYLIAVLNACQFFGRIAAAAISDCVGAEIIHFCAILAGGILSFCWISINSKGSFIAFLCFYGFASGVTATLPAIIIPYLCPSLAVVGTRTGMVYAAAGLGALISVPVAAAIQDGDKAWFGVQLWTGSCFMAAALLFILPGIAAYRQRVNSTNFNRSDRLRSNWRHRRASLSALYEKSASDDESETTIVNAACPLPSESSQDGVHIVLTGSTGYLGTFLLHSLMTNVGIAHVTCLNRSSDAAKRQHQRHSAFGLSTDFAKVSFIRCDLRRQDLDISSDAYSKLLATTTYVIHNAWPVDFNLSFSSFKPQIRGLKNLIRFAKACRQDPTLAFTSSISVVARWGTVPGALATVPETIHEDWRLAKMGYGQSKLVSERLLHEASALLGVRTAVIRLGQLSGPVGISSQTQASMWKPEDWFPSLVFSSREMRTLPQTLGPIADIDWVPVDLAAQIMVDLLLEDQSKREDQMKHESHDVKGRQNHLGKLRAADTLPGHTYDEDSIPLTTCKVNPQGHGAKNSISIWTKSGKHRSRRQCKVFHITNPRSVSYADLLPSITACFPQDAVIVPFTAWVEHLESSGTAMTDNSTFKDQHTFDNPAFKLQPYFQDLADKAIRFPRSKSAILDTKHTIGHSTTMRDLNPIGPTQVQIWMRQWGFKGQEVHDHGQI